MFFQILTKLDAEHGLSVCASCFELSIDPPFQLTQHSPVRTKLHLNFHNNLRCQQHIGDSRLPRRCISTGACNNESCKQKKYKAAPMANETSFELPQQLKLPIGLMHYRTACRCIATRSFLSASWAQHGASWAQLGCPWGASGRLLGQLGRPWALLGVS